MIALRFLMPRVACILAIVLSVEAAFRLGFWESFAKPDSNAGMAIRAKQAINAIDAKSIDFITVGDSRAVYGIDHERVAALAKSLGLTHINASIPGMHWMSTDLMIRWIRNRAPNLKGALIATNLTNFSYIGNGDYELGIATPLASISDTTWMQSHVPFERKNLATYGGYSALFQYREDIADFVKHPVLRVAQLSRHRQAYAGGVSLTQTQRVPTNICSVPSTSIKACAETRWSAENSAVIGQCKSLLAQSANQLDFREFNNAAKWPHLAGVKKIRQAQLRSLTLAKPAVVVLMPVPKVWRDELLPKGAEDWVLSVLEPLADEGIIELHNFTHFFDLPDGTECGAFWDLYHQNEVGQQKLTAALLPIIERQMYLRGPTK